MRLGSPFPCRRVLLSAAGVLFLAGLDGPVGAAEVEREIEVSIRGDVRTERIHTVVRPGPDDDPGEAASVVILTDFDRELVEAQGWCIAADGKRRKVRRKNRDVMEWSGASLHDSAVYRVLSCPDAVAGDRIEATWEVRGTPVFRGGFLSLAADPGDRLTRLQVTLLGNDLRWNLTGDTEALTETRIDGGVRFDGRDLELDEDLGPLAQRVDLLYAWGPERSWDDVASWYRDLLASLPRADPEVRAAARQAAADLPVDEAIEEIAALVQRDVRYVAVQIGVGGWRPSAPAEVWERRWGDCKDKTLLLIDLLREVGVEARPAMALLGGDRRVQAGFPNPFQFNHLVAAVPVSALEDPPATAPVVGDWLIIDATQSRGGAGWLNPSVQGQLLLLVGEEGGELLEAPLTPAAESLRVDVQVGADRTGELTLDLVGREASDLLDRLKVTQPAMIDDVARRLANGVLGPVELVEPKWQRSIDREAPTLRLVAGVRWPPSLPMVPPEVRWLPEPRNLDLDDTVLPFAVHPGTLEVHWRGPLEPGCVTTDRNDRVTANELGRVEQSTTSAAAGEIEVHRRVGLERRWIDEAAALEGLRELSLAEHRMLGRQLRLRCAVPPSGGNGGS